MTDGEVVYEPTPRTDEFIVEYLDKFQLWTNAQGTWTFDGKDYTIRDRYHSSHPAYEMAELLAWNGYRSRVVKYESKED